MTILQRKFRLGNIYATPGVLASIPHDEVIRALARHLSGDWGDVDAEDREENDYSLGRRLRLLSAYHSRAGVKFWIITEADRSATTVLLPDEY
jgi:hypothetical protein